MQIIVLCGISLLIAILALLYFSFESIKDDKLSVNKINELVHKKTVWYVIAMLVVLCFMSVSLVQIYPSNTLIFNIKRIVLLGILFCAAYIDYKEYIIPNKLILIGLFARCVIWFVELFLKLKERKVKRKVRKRKGKKRKLKCKMKKTEKLTFNFE